LAGHSPAEAEGGEGTLGAVRRAYGELSYANLAHHKMGNVRSLFDSEARPRPVSLLLRLANPAKTGAAVVEIRTRTFHHPVWALGLLNLGLFAWFSRWLYGNHHGRTWRWAGAGLLCLGLTGAAWCLALFGPGATNAVHDPFFVVILGIASFVAALWGVSRRLAVTVVLLNIGCQLLLFAPFAEAANAEAGVSSYSSGWLTVTGILFFGAICGLLIWRVRASWVAEAEVPLESESPSCVQRPGRVIRRFGVDRWGWLRHVRPHVGIVLVTLCYLAITFVTFNQIEEDAFIYFRFARNLAEGHGYVFNPGGEHIESGSSLLWQFLLVPVYLSRVDVIIGAKLLCIAFGCLALWLTYKLSQRFIIDGILQLAPPLLLAVSVPFFCWSQRGLETPFYLCTVLLLCYACCHDRLRDYWYVFAFIVFCSRPEGFFVLLATAPFLVMERQNIRGFYRGILVLVALCGLVTVLRLIYFHDPFPHPFYVKTGRSVGKGFEILGDYVRHNCLLFLLIPLLLALLNDRIWSRRFAVLISFLTILAIWAILGWDKKHYDRHLIPALAFLFVAAVAGLSQLPATRVPAALTRLYCVAFAGYMLWFSQTGCMKGLLRPSVFAHSSSIVMRDPVAHFRKIADLATDPDRCATQRNRRDPLGILGEEGLHGPINANYQVTTGKFLRLNYPRNITVVHDQMGQTPWYAGNDKIMIDAGGLLDKRIGYYIFRLRARNKWPYSTYEAVMRRLADTFWPEEDRRVTQADALDHVFDRQPEVIIVSRRTAKLFPGSLIARVLSDPRLAENYTHAYRLDGLLEVFEKKDTFSRRPVRVPPGAKVMAMGGHSGGKPAGEKSHRKSRAIRPANAAANPRTIRGDGRQAIRR
jgi:hypothetical protein